MDLEIVLGGYEEVLIGKRLLREEKVVEMSVIEQKPYNREKL